MNLLEKIFGKKDHPTDQEVRNYLDGNLDKGTVRKVESAISQNPLLSDAVDGFREFGTDEMDAVPDFDTFYNQKGRKDGNRNIRQYINWLMAALLALFLMAALYLYWSESETERVFADNFAEFKDPSISDSRNGADGKEWSPVKEKALTYFQAKDYPKSILYWEKSLEADAEDTQSKFYLGFAHLNDGNPSKAIEYLSAIAGEDSKYKNDSKWYLALAQLKIKDKEGARETLEDLEKTGDNFYSKQARSILEEL